jgi:hypothetical protein
MALGQATQNATYSKSADETFADVQKALNMIGKVTSADKTILTIEGTSKYGFGSVKLKVKINPQEKTSIISLSGFSDDVWAAGAKKCMKRLLETMDNLGNLDYKPSRTGMKPVNMALILIAFILQFLEFSAVLANLPSLVSGGVKLLGFVLLVYFIIARMRFGKK